MTDLYLSRVRIKDFRSFGEFEVDIPPGPGLTLVVGPNGLGKSSFFDAIEWALTGKVQRLGFLPAKTPETDYLRRRGASGHHAVTLGFSDAGEVDRSGGSGPDPQSVITLLKKPEWNEIKDLAGYLAFTHFLGQGYPQRFTSRKAEDQWEALRGPSGIDRLEDIRQGLRGRSTTVAFTRRIREETAAVETLQARLQEWRRLIDRLSVARDASAAAGALDPDAFTSRIQALDRQLGQAVDLNVVARPDETFSAALARQLGLIQSRRNAIQDGLRRLAEFDLVPQRYAVALANAALDGPALVSARSTTDSARTGLDAAIAVSTAAQASLDAASLTASNLRMQHAALQGIAGQRSELASLTGQIGLLSGARTEDEEALAKASASRILLEEQVAGARGREEALAVHAAEAQSARAVAQAAREFDALRRRREADEVEAKESLEKGEAARSSLAGLTERQRLLLTDQASLQARLDDRRRISSALSTAVAQIAAHLHEDDADCPVCQSRIGAGRLLTLARASAEADDSELAVNEVLLSRVSAELTQVEADLLGVQAVITAAQSAASRIRELDATIAEKEADLRRRLQNPPANADLVAIAEAAELTASVVHVTALEATAGDAVLIAEGEARLVALVSEIATLNLRLLQTSQSLASAEARRGETQRRLDDQNQTALNEAAFAEQLADIADKLESAAAAVRSCQEAVDAANRDVLVARARHDSALAAASASEAARAVAETQAKGFADRWTREGLPGTPTADAVQARRAELNGQAAALERLEDERSQLVAALDVEAQRTVLQAIMAEMNDIGGADAANQPMIHEGLIIAELADAEKALTRTKKVAGVVRAFSTTLLKEAESFSSKFLEPLNDLIGTYNEALLSTPGDSVQFQANNRIDTTKFEMGLKYRDRWEDHSNDKSLPPHAILSEGQIAANGFSILCAASTAYPWSRWRALLMDDPLQHNDIIHAAAFVDLMRNLVQMKDYQLLMSSHDRAEAEFIMRKFDAADLPCRVIDLTAPARSGVRYELPSPNMAAHNLLQAGSTPI